MNESFFQGESSINNNSQDDNRQDIKQNQNDQLVFNIDRSINLPKSIQMVQISQDEKYLAILRELKIIQIYYFKKKKLIKKLEDEKHSIWTIKFSNNSRHLLFGDDYGYLGCFDINHNYKLIFYQKVHSLNIQNILSIDDEWIITSSYDFSLIITNIKYKQQLLKIKIAHKYIMEGIEFDRSNDFIISISNCSLNFFNRKDGKLQFKQIINQQNAHQTRNNGVQMIQLIEKDNHLISLTIDQLILWQIDYLNRKLIKLKEFNNRIYNFTSVFNNSKIVVICDKCIHILDKDLVVVQTINLNLKLKQYYFISRQLDSLNYIQIQTSRSFLVLKKVRKLQN